MSITAPVTPPCPKRLFQNNTGIVGPNQAPRASHKPTKKSTQDDYTPCETKPQKQHQAPTPQPPKTDKIPKRDKASIDAEKFLNAILAGNTQTKNNQNYTEITLQTHHVFSGYKENNETITDVLKKYPGVIEWFKKHPQWSQELVAFVTEEDDMPTTHTPPESIDTLLNSQNDKIADFKDSPLLKKLITQFKINKNNSDIKQLIRMAILLRAAYVSDVFLFEINNKIVNHNIADDQTTTTKKHIEEFLAEAEKLANRYL